MDFHLFPALFVGGEIVDLVRETGAVAQAVLLLLLAFSLISWAIILSRWSVLSRARIQSGRFLRAFRRAQRLEGIAAGIEAVPPKPPRGSVQTRIQGIAALGVAVGAVGETTAVRRA